MAVAYRHLMKETLCGRVKLLSSGVDLHQPLIFADVCKDVLLQKIAPEVFAPANLACCDGVSCHITDHIFWLQQQDSRMADVTAVAGLAHCTCGRSSRTRTLHMWLQ